MDFALAAPTAATAVKQSKHTIRIGVAIAQEVAEIFRQARAAVAGSGRKAVGLFGFDGLPQCRRHAFVGIQAQYPVVGGLLDRIGLLRSIAVEIPMQYARAL